MGAQQILLECTNDVIESEEIKNQTFLCCKIPRYNSPPLSLICEFHPFALLIISILLTRICKDTYAESASTCSYDIEPEDLHGTSWGFKLNSIDELSKIKFTKKIRA